MCWSPPVSPGSSGSEIIKLNQPGKWKPAWWLAKTSTPLWGRLIYCFFSQHGTLKHIPFNSESWNVQLPSWKSVVKRPMNSDFQLGKSFGNLQPWFCKMQMCIVIYHILISLIIEHGIACSCIWFLYMSFPEHQEPEDPYGWRWSSRNIPQHSPWVSYDDRNTESEATGFWSTVHTHIRTETRLAHTPGSWNHDLWTSPTIHHGLASSASCETYAHTGICDPSAHSESWGPFIKRWRHWD